MFTCPPLHSPLDVCPAGSPQPVLHQLTWTLLLWGLSKLGFLKATLLGCVPAPPTVPSFSPEVRDAPTAPDWWEQRVAALRVTVERGGLSPGRLPLAASDAIVSWNLGHGAGLSVCTLVPFLSWVSPGISRTQEDTEPQSNTAQAWPAWPILFEPSLLEL